MTALASSPVTIQTTAQSVPSMPGWFGEGTVIAHYLWHLSMLSAIEERVRYLVAHRVGQVRPRKKS